jgi:hypothetical protein
MMRKTATPANPPDAELLSFAMAAESSQEQKSKGGGGGEPGESGEGPQKLAKKGEELKEEMDALVDEIAQGRDGRAGG